MHKRRVPVLVYHPYDTQKKGYASIELYGFDENLVYPMFAVDCPLPPNLSDKDDEVHVLEDSYRARPFTVLNSCPDGCVFAPLGDHIYVTGGTELSSHHIERLDLSRNVSDVVEVAAENPRLDPNLSPDKASAFAERSSKRVKRFQIPKFIDSLFGNNERGELELADLDGVSNDLSSYWETCPSMSERRSQHDLLTLGGKLYAIGGDEIDESTEKASFSIEVFEPDGWTPLLIQPPLDIVSYGLVSFAIEESNSILIGSVDEDEFYVIHVSDEKGVATCEKKRLMSSDHLLATGFNNPVLVDNHCLMWYDTSGAFIRGFHLSTNSYFTVGLRKKILVPANRYNIGSAQLTNLGDGILCLIYTAPEIYVSFDEHGVEHVLRDYRSVTFKIDFRDFLENGCGEPFPGIQLETIVLSRRTCYAPSVGHLNAAFAMDVNFPDQSIRMPKKGRYFDVTGGSQISDTNLGFAPTQKPPPPSTKSKRKSRGT